MGTAPRRWWLLGSLAYPEGWSVCGGPPARGGHGSQGNQKRRGRETNLSGNTAGTFLCQWKDLGTVFAWQAFQIHHFSICLLVGTDGPQCISVPRWKLRPGGTSKVWFPLFFHPLFTLQENLSFCGPYERTRFLREPEFENHGHLRWCVPCECSLKKMFPRHLEVGAEFVKIPFHRSVYMSRITQGQLDSFFFNE